MLEEGAGDGDGEGVTKQYEFLIWFAYTHTKGGCRFWKEGL